MNKIKFLIIICSIFLLCSCGNSVEGTYKQYVTYTEDNATYYGEIILTEDGLFTFTNYDMAFVNETMVYYHGNYTCDSSDKCVALFTDPVENDEYLYEMTLYFNDDIICLGEEDCTEYFVKTTSKKGNEFTVEPIQFDEVDLEEWKAAVDNGLVVTVIGRTTCPHCREYKPVIEAASKKYGFTLYFIEIDNMNEEQFDALMETYDFKNFESSIPYTAVLNKGKYVADTTGYEDETDAMNFLKKAGVIK